MRQDGRAVCQFSTPAKPHRQKNCPTNTRRLSAEAGPRDRIEHPPRRYFVRVRLHFNQLLRGALSPDVGDLKAWSLPINLCSDKTSRFAIR